MSITFAESIKRGSDERTYFTVGPIINDFDQGNKWIFTLRKLTLHLGVPGKQALELISQCGVNLERNSKIGVKEILINSINVECTGSKKALEVKSVFIEIDEILSLE